MQYSHHSTLKTCSYSTFMVLLFGAIADHVSTSSQSRPFLLLSGRLGNKPELTLQKYVQAHFVHRK